MPSIRVYPTDSGVCGYFWSTAEGTDGIFEHVNFNDVQRAPTMRAFTEYNTTLPGGTFSFQQTDNSKAAMLRFSFDKIPELQKKKIAARHVKYIYIRSARDYSLPGGSKPLVEWHTHAASGNGSAGHSYTESRDKMHLMRTESPRYFSFDELESGWYMNNESPFRRAIGLSARVTPPGVIGRVTFGAEFIFDGHTGEYPPYTDVAYESVTPFAENQTLHGNDASRTITASWDFSYPFRDYELTAEFVINGIISQKSAKLRWRPVGETDFTEYRIDGAANSFEIPANTINASTIEWQVIVMSDDDVQADDPGWIQASIINPVITPTNLSPKGQIINGAVSNFFTWQTLRIGDSEQAEFEALYSQDNGMSWAALSREATSRKSFGLAADRLETGTYRWQIRCRNRAGVWGIWSEAAVFLVQSGLFPPVITSISGKPRPLVVWSSSGQQAWQMLAFDATGKLLYDSGTVYGNAKQYTIPLYLASGKILVKVRIANIFGFWSDWGARETVIENVSGKPINLQTHKIPNGAKLMWETAGQYIKYHIYRDGEKVASTTATDFKDWLANGKRVYFVRGITADDYYTDSGERIEITQVKGVVVAPVGEIETAGWFRMTSKIGSEPVVSSTWEQKVSFVHYDGRVKCVAEVSEFEDAQHELSFTLSKEDVALFNRLAGKTVIVKDCFGLLVVGHLYKNSKSRHPLSGKVDVSFSVVETDFKEGADDD